MKRVVCAVASSVGFAFALLAFSPQEGFSQNACGGGFCASERSACIEICGRCGVQEFACTIGGSCSSDCKCRQPCTGG